MRVERFQEALVEAYSGAPGVVSAQPWQDGTRRPFGVEVQLAGGRTVRHAITRVRVQGEDVAQLEQVTEGEPPTPVEPWPEPKGVRDRQTAAFLAAAVSAAGLRELSRVYVYGEASQHAGLGAECHSGARLHMLLV